MRILTSSWSKQLSDGSRLNVWLGDGGEWYWNRVAGNGQKIATGGEGFTRKWSAKRAALRSVR